MYQNLFSSKGETFFFVCALSTYNTFIGGKFDYFFCPKARAFAFAAV